MIKCDRCKKEVDGAVDGILSAGCYVGWLKFMNPGEHLICDACMWSDPRYIAVYGVNLTLEAQQ
jgi:hypothetical protein